MVRMTRSRAQALNDETTSDTEISPHPAPTATEREPRKSTRAKRNTARLETPVESTSGSSGEPKPEHSVAKRKTKSRTKAPIESMSPEKVEVDEVIDQMAEVRIAEKKTALRKARSKVAKTSEDVADEVIRTTSPVRTTRRRNGNAEQDQLLTTDDLSKDVDSEDGEMQTTDGLADGVETGVDGESAPAAASPIKPAAKTAAKTRTRAAAKVVDIEEAVEIQPLAEKQEGKEKSSGAQTPHRTTSPSKKLSSTVQTQALSVGNAIYTPMKELSLTPRQKRIAERSAIAGETSTQESQAQVSVASRSSAQRSMRARPSPQPVKGLVGQRISIFNQEQDSISAPCFSTAKVLNTPSRQRQTIATTPSRTNTSEIVSTPNSIRKPSAPTVPVIVMTPKSVRKPLAAQATETTPRSVRKPPATRVTATEPPPKSARRPPVSPIKSTRVSPRKPAVMAEEEATRSSTIEHVSPRKATAVVEKAAKQSLKALTPALPKATETVKLNPAKPAPLPAVLRKATPVVALTKAAQLRAQQAALAKTGKKSDTVIPTLSIGPVVKPRATVKPIERKVVATKLANTITVLSSTSGVSNISKPKATRPVGGSQTRTETKPLPVTRSVPAVASRVSEVAKQVLMQPACSRQTAIKPVSLAAVQQVKMRIVSATVNPKAVEKIAPSLGKKTVVPARQAQPVSNLASQVEEALKVGVAAAISSLKLDTIGPNTSIVKESYSTQATTSIPTTTPLKANRSVSSPLKITAKTPITISRPSMLVSPSKPPTQVIPFSLAGNEHARKAAALREERAKKREEEEKLAKTTQSVRPQAPVPRPRPTMMQRSLSTSARVPLAVASASVTNSHKPVIGLRRPAAVVLPHKRLIVAKQGLPSAPKASSQTDGSASGPSASTDMDEESIAKKKEVELELARNGITSGNLYSHAMELLDVQVYKEVERMPVSGSSTPVRAPCAVDEEVMNSIQKEKFRLEASVRGHQALLQWASQQGAQNK